MKPTDAIAVWGLLLEALMPFAWFGFVFCLYQLGTLENEKPAPLSATMLPDEEAHALPFGLTPSHQE